MNPVVFSIIQRLHDTSGQAVMHVAGGGASAIGWLQAVPGGSRTLLRATVPYHPSALADIVGYAPEQAVAVETALVMAEKAYREAKGLVEEGAPAIGVSCTATLVTDRPKKGQHRCHLAFMTETAARHYALVLTKGMRDREAEDDVVSRLVLRALAEAKGLAADIDLGLRGDERVEAQDLPSIPGLQAFVSGERPLLVIPPNGKAHAGPVEPSAVLSGSFNPLHEGHRQLAEAAARTIGGDVAFEIPAVNADKPQLAELQIRRRAMQFAGWATLVITRAPTFAEKARLLPGKVFVVGVDTAERILDPRFYGGTGEGMQAALEVVRRTGCRFIVAGRVENGRFTTLADMRVPAEFADLFQGIPPEEFRVDISSTELRRAQE